ncbi:MAG: hypothetical protein IPH31_21315 [Lewinellaceae bacterium]|nr:hypothetical protein [Lewinellaceae bacterium]
MAVVTDIHSVVIYPDVKVDTLIAAPRLQRHGEWPNTAPTISQAVLLLICSVGTTGLYHRKLASIAWGLGFTLAIVDFNNCKN